MAARFFCFFCSFFGSKLQAGTSIEKGAGLSDGLCVQAVHLPSPRKRLLAPAERRTSMSSGSVSCGKCASRKKCTQVVVMRVFLRYGGTSFVLALLVFRKKTAAQPPQLQAPAGASSSSSIATTSSACSQARFATVHLPSSRKRLLAPAERETHETNARRSW
jgi:hypothetical protein